jgi:hypothetical protein
MGGRYKDQSEYVCTFYDEARSQTFRIAYFPKAGRFGHDFKGG